MSNGWGVEGLYSIFIYGNSHIAVYSRIPTLPELVEVSPTMQTMIAPSAKHREVFGESREG